ncbi:unnamed protein product, partial [Rotaria sp. Silwood1]
MDSDLLKIYTQRINDDEFNEVLQKSDYILPLIHPSSEKYHEYLTTVLSGAFNTAFAFTKALL